MYLSAIASFPSANPFRPIYIVCPAFVCLFVQCVKLLFAQFSDEWIKYKKKCINIYKHVTYKSKHRIGINLILNFLFIHMYYLKWNLPFRPSVGWLVGWSVDLSCHTFQKKGRSFTSMLLSEHLFQISPLQEQI